MLVFEQAKCFVISSCSDTDNEPEIDRVASIAARIHPTMTAEIVHSQIDHVAMLENRENRLMVTVLLY